MLWFMLHDYLKEMNNHNDKNNITFVCCLIFKKSWFPRSEMSLSKYRSCDGDSSIILSQFTSKQNEN